MLGLPIAWSSDRSLGLLKQNTRRLILNHVLFFTWSKFVSNPFTSIFQHLKSAFFTSSQKGRFDRFFFLFLHVYTICPGYPYTFKVTVFESSFLGTLSSQYLVHEELIWDLHFLFWRSGFVQFFWWFVYCSDLCKFIKDLTSVPSTARTY